jgi:hypothetical protein
VVVGQKLIKPKAVIGIKLKKSYNPKYVPMQLARGSSFAGKLKLLFYFWLEREKNMIYLMFMYIIFFFCLFFGSLLQLFKDFIYISGYLLHKICSNFRFVSCESSG